MSTSLVKYKAPTGGSRRPKGGGAKRPRSISVSGNTRWRSVRTTQGKGQMRTGVTATIGGKKTSYSGFNHGSRYRKGNTGRYTPRIHKQRNVTVSTKHAVAGVAGAAAVGGAAAYGAKRYRKNNPKPAKAPMAPKTKAHRAGVAAVTASSTFSGAVYGASFGGVRGAKVGAALGAASGYAAGRSAVNRERRDTYKTQQRRAARAQNKNPTSPAKVATHAPTKPGSRVKQKGMKR